MEYFGSISTKYEHLCSFLGSASTRELCGSRVLTISASLSGGKGDVSWQHAQLFRQSSDSEDFPFSLRIKFK